MAGKEKTCDPNKNDDDDLDELLDSKKVEINTNNHTATLVALLLYWHTAHHSITGL